MKTLTKTIAALATLLLVTGCTAAVAEDATTATTKAFTPGWRHEQMVQAWEKGEMPGPMMMRGRGGFGPGMRGQGPGMAAAIGPDGKIDTTKLPPWCPLNQAGAATESAK